MFCRSRRERASRSIRVTTKVSPSEELKQRLELLAALGSSAGHLLGSHHGTAGGGERGMLDGQSKLAPARCTP